MRTFLQSFGIWLVELAEPGQVRPGPPTLAPIAFKEFKPLHPEPQSLDPAGSERPALDAHSCLNSILQVLHNMPNDFEHPASLSQR